MHSSPLLLEHLLAQYHKVTFTVTSHLASSAKAVTCLSTPAQGPVESPAQPCMEGHPASTKIAPYFLISHLYPVTHACESFSLILLLPSFSQSLWQQLVKCLLETSGGCRNCVSSVPPFSPLPGHHLVCEVPILLAEQGLCKGFSCASP